MDVFDFLSRPAIMRETSVRCSQQKNEIHQHIHIHIDTNDKKQLEDVKRVLLQSKKNATILIEGP